MTETRIEFVSSFREWRKLMPFSALLHSNGFFLFRDTRTRNLNVIVGPHSHWMSASLHSYTRICKRQFDWLIAFHVFSQNGGRSENYPQGVWMNCSVYSATVSSGDVKTSDAMKIEYFIHVLDISWKILKDLGFSCLYLLCSPAPS